MSLGVTKRYDTNAGVLAGNSDQWISISIGGKLNEIILYAFNLASIHTFLVLQISTLKIN